MKLFEIKLTELSVDEAVSRVASIVTSKKEPIALLLVGVPASGKSTFTKKLEAAVKSANEVMLPIESTDDQLEVEAKKLGLTYTEFFKKHRDMLDVFAKKMVSNVKDHVQAKRGFIIDQTMLDSSKRKERLALTSNDYYRVAITFEIDPTVVDARLEDRFKKTGKKIPADVMASMREKYQRPTTSEGFNEVIVITS